MDRKKTTCPETFDSDDPLTCCCGKAVWQDRVAARRRCGRLTFLMGTAVACLIQMRSGIANVVHAQSGHAATIAHVFSGADGQSHAEQLDMGHATGATPLLPISGNAELRWSTPNPSVPGTWHPERQRMYVITLSGHGEIEVADGQRVPLEPGKLELVEDLTGKGHISRAIGTEDRVALWLPLADQTPPARRPSAAAKTQ